MELYKATQDWANFPVARLYYGPDEKLQVLDSAVLRIAGELMRAYKKYLIAVLDKMIELDIDENI